MVRNHKLLPIPVNIFIKDGNFCVFKINPGMRFLPKFYCFVLLLLLSRSSAAQQPLNFDFEKKSVEGIKRPWGWDIDQLSAGSAIGLDSVMTHHGKFSLRIFSDQAHAKDVAAGISYAIEPYSLKGKTIVVEGWTRTSSPTGRPSCILRYLVDRSENFTDDTIRLPSFPTEQWNHFSAKLIVPHGKVTQVAVQLLQQGAGTSWFDDLSFAVSGKKIVSVPVARSFEPKEKQWIARNTVPFVSADAGDAKTNSTDADLVFLKDACRNASVMAFGESTHGTSEFFRLKHRLLAYAVKQLGVRLFAIEDNQVIVEKVNNYIRGGKGTARSAMYGMFSVWQNEEVHNMIQWLRDYNDLHPADPVQFAGFDIQDLRSPADSLAVYLKRKDPLLADSVSSMLLPLLQNPQSHYAATAGDKAAWNDASAKAYACVKQKENGWLRSSTTDNERSFIRRTLQYANLVKQYAHNLYTGHLPLYRDTAMAENIGWLLSMQPPGSKIVVWAHDNHISRGDDPVKENNIYGGISMGAHLSKKFGGAYKAFGLSSYTGTYWAQVSYSDFKQLDCPLLPAPGGSLDEALHEIAARTHRPLLFMRMDDARQQPWLSQPIPTRFANHVNIEYGYWTRSSLPFQFDGIFFIDTSSAAKSYAR
jgi:erythromycin esterase